jgi:hypothetical protein
VHGSHDLDTPSLVPIAIVGVVGIYVGSVMWSMEHATYDVWGGLLLAPVLLLLTWPLAHRAARRESDPRMVRLLLTALVLKLVASLVRYAIAFDVYDGVADADGYHKNGELFAKSFRHFDFTVDSGKVIGTGFIKILTGLIYAVIGPTKIGGYLVFSWIGFWGLYLFYRAFCIAVQNGDRYRYAKLVFFLPSLLFWPSGIGKEAWMTLTLGMCALGAARVLTGKRGGFLLVVSGIGLTILARPHMAILVMGGLTVGYMLRPRPAHAHPLFAPVFKSAGVVVIVLVGYLVLGQAEQFFGVDDFNSDSVEQVLVATEGQTSQGGSQFEAQRVTSPLQLPQAFIAVMYRPFPQEADNAQSLAAALEGLFLLILSLRSWRRIVNAGRLSRRSPYVAYAWTYVLLFVIAFSSFGNFGIVTRQRVQVFPLFLILLALPLPDDVRRTEDTNRSYPPRRELVPLGRP